MDLKSLLLNLIQTIEFLWTMTPTIDQKLIVLLAGLLLGWLEMAGFADPANHAQDLNELSQFLGAGITAVTIASYFIHNAIVEHAKIKYGQNATQSPTTPISPKSSIINQLKNFIVSNPTTPPQNE